MGAKNNFPWDIRDVEPELSCKLAKYFKNEHTSYIRVGPKGYFFPKTFTTEAANIYNMEVRSSDVFVASYPRSGSTWSRELVWIVANDWDFAKSETVPLFGRFMFLEFPTLVHPMMTENILSETTDAGKIKRVQTITLPGTQRLAQAESPRFVYTHLPISLLPPSLLDTAKVVYVARDPRDVVVSFFHMNRLHRLLGYYGDFKTFWNFFVSGSIYWTPYFDNIKEAWEARHHPNMLFLFYEDMSKVFSTINSPIEDSEQMDLKYCLGACYNLIYSPLLVCNKEYFIYLSNFYRWFNPWKIIARNTYIPPKVKDLPAVIRRVATFLNKPYTEDQVTRLSQHLSIDSFRSNKSVNYDIMDELGLLNHGEEPYIRKGKTGGWRDYFDDDMTQQAERWMEDNLRDTDLRFPQK